ncbi:DUF1574 family protein [Candidatus Omnitrophota bacterium]
MAKNSSISNFKDIPREYILVILLITIFEVSLCFLPEYKTFDKPYGYAALKLKGEIADSENSYELIILGDCTGWAGIRPRVLEKDLSITAFNLSTNVEQTYLTQYILLKRYLQNCLKKPKLVILQLSGNSLTGKNSIDFNALRSHILTHFRMDSDFLGEFSAEMRHKSNIFKMMCMIPSIRYQYFFRKKTWLKNIWENNREDYERYRNIYVYERGFFNENLDPNKSNVEKITDIGKDLKMFNVSDHNIRYIKKIIRLLDESGIKTLVCVSPVRNDAMVLWDKYEVSKKLEETIKEMLDGYGSDIIFLGSSDIAYDKKYFIDALHLNEEGANIFTHRLAEKIEKLSIY